MPPGPNVVFTSQAYRGLADLIALWRTRIVPQAPSARLAAYIAAEDLARYREIAAGEPSISLSPRVANADMPSLLRGARLLVAPGHPSETFCLSAAEAVAMGVPVVTLGHGALSERVAHGETGFISRSWSEMAGHILALLGDDALWRRMQAAGLASRAGAGWDRKASLWDSAFGGSDASSVQSRFS